MKSSILFARAKSAYYALIPSGNTGQSLLVQVQLPSKEPSFDIIE